MTTRSRSRSQLATHSDTTPNATPTKNSSSSRESTNSSTVTSSQNGSPNPPTPNSNKENECGDVSVAKTSTQQADEDLQDEQGDKWTLYSDEMNVHFSDPNRNFTLYSVFFKNNQKPVLFAPIRL